MMPLKVILSYTAASAALFGFVAWRLHTAPPAVPIITVLVDHSGSKLNPCGALAGAVERVVASPPLELSVLLVGDAHSAYAPLLMTLPPVPQQKRLIKGRSRQLAERQAFVGDVAARCGEEATPLTSPIFLGIQQAVAHLRAAPGRGDRELHVVSDLRENHEPRITAALAEPVGKKAKLPIIDNTASAAAPPVTISVCGYAETQQKEPPGKRPPQIARLLEVWPQVFSDPARVSFKPYCPPATAPQEDQ